MSWLVEAGYTSQVKFIKFFAWEEQWIKRTLDARENEIRWMRKGLFLLHAKDISNTNCSGTARTNSVLFSLIWSLAPIFISVTAFFVYVMLGNELTIGTAFTVGSYVLVGERKLTVG